MKTIRVFDTTLRDGEQGIGHLMSMAQKECLVKAMDGLNLDIIELGFPAASSEDLAWFQRAAQLHLKTKVCAFSRLLMSDLQITRAIMKSFDQPQIQLLAIGSEIHLEHKRQMTLAMAIDELNKAIYFLRAEGVEDIAIILEDATRGSRTLLKAMIEVAIEAGASSITLADTVGCARPANIYDLVYWAKAWLPETIRLGIHCHNDLGLATANTLAAIEAGVDMIQTTFGGIGERAGNCALEEVAAVLHYKADDYSACLAMDLKAIVGQSHGVFTTLNKKVPHNKPLLGEHVFSTAAGIHQNGLLKNPLIYEYVRAIDVGRELHFVKNRLSSKKLVVNTGTKKKALWMFKEHTPAKSVDTLTSCHAKTMIQRTQAC